MDSIWPTLSKFIFIRKKREKKGNTADAFSGKKSIDSLKDLVVNVNRENHLEE